MKTKKISQFLVISLLVSIVMLYNSCKEEADENTSPVAAFTASPTSGIAPVTVNFTDQSSSSPTSWQWDFGDGGLSTQQNPSHTYYTSGTHTVELVVTNSYGTDKETMNDYISVNVGAVTSEPCPGIPTFTYQGQVYNTVLVGSQCWMKENLNYATGNSWCYDNDPFNCDTYGRLYDWATIMNGEFTSNEIPSGVQGICPPGWHVPSDAEWDILINHLGGSTVAGGKMKEAEYAHWYSPNTDATNESGFTALPGGFRSSSSGFTNRGEISWFWSCTNYSFYYGWSRMLDNNSGNVIRFGSGKDYGYSLRCIKD